MIHKIPLKKIEILGGGMHLAAGINSTHFSNLAIIDTGASQSIFDYEIIDSFIIETYDADDDGLSSGVNSNLSDHKIARLGKLSLESMSLNKFKAGIMNLSHIRNLYKSQFDIEICGLIGGDILNLYNAVIDYQKSLLLLHKH